MKISCILLLAFLITLAIQQKFCCQLNYYSICQDDMKCCDETSSKTRCVCTDSTFGTCYACGCVKATDDNLLTQ